MAHGIDPTADYAFKLLFGTEENKDLLLHFLNGILEPEVPIVELTLVNPFVPSQFDGDDLTVVDVRARDARGHVFAVEIQNHVRPVLRHRATYTLSDLYQAQMGEGGDFADLRPVHNIWLLNQNLLTGATGWRHHFQLRDPDGLVFSDHLNLHTVELRKWRHPNGPLAPADQWVYFLREAAGWDLLPRDLFTPEMMKAMATLNRIFDKQEDYLRYQARENFLREQRTLQRELAEERAALEAERAKVEQERAKVEQERHARDRERLAKEQERAAKEQERAAKEHALQAEREALARVQALEARLRALGVEPE